MPLHDRDEVLRRTDLPRLADELLGGHVGRGRSAKWPSPVPGHPQTGRTPPMSIFTSRRGEQRWTCFATGTGGTAIDLIMTATGRDAGQAIAYLAHRATLTPTNPAPPARPTVADRQPRSPPRVRGRVDAYVHHCEQHLWQPDGREALDWLTDRGIDPDVLRHNRVGYDPGPDRFARPPGLPRLGPGVVLPVLNADDRAIYLQVRYLDPSTTGRKYDNPPQWTAPNPRTADIRPRHTDTPGPPCLLVAEGLPDGLAAASHDLRTVVALGTHTADRDTARHLSEIGLPIVIAFDNDPAGHAAAERLHDHLTAIGHPHGATVCTPPHPYNDLTDWLRATTGPAIAADPPAPRPTLTPARMAATTSSLDLA